MKVYDGNQKAIMMIPYYNGIITAFKGAGIYYSHDGNHLGDTTAPGSQTEQVYNDVYDVVKMIPFWSGVLTAWQFGSIYYSSNGRDLGGGGGTNRVFPITANVPPTTPKVVDMIAYGGLIVAFDDGHVYKSNTLNNLHGGPGTVEVYYDPAPQNIVAKMIPFKVGVLTAFRWGGIYYSANGEHLAGGGDPATDWRAYPEPGSHATKKMIAMVPYKQGVITAFDNQEIYYSKDGKHLGNEIGNTSKVYGGPRKLKAIACGDVGSGPEVVAAFDDGCIYRSKNGFKLGEVAGQTTKIYP